MASNPQILSDLRVIYEADHQIELLTLYKGVPFICKAKIEELNDDSVRMYSTDKCIVCFETDKKPRVLGSDYFEPSIAEVRSVDLKEGVVVLGDFSYVGTKLGERMIVRVEPKSPIQIQILIDTTDLVGVIADISLNGIGVLVLNEEYISSLKPGVIVKVSFELPSGLIELSGTVLSVVKLEEHIRLSIKFRQEGDQKFKIFRYLVDRRDEISRELIQKYNTRIMNLTAGE